METRPLTDEEVKSDEDRYNLIVWLARAFAGGFYGLLTLAIVREALMQQHSAMTIRVLLSFGGFYLLILFTVSIYKQ